MSAPPTLLFTPKGAWGRDTGRGGAGPQSVQVVLGVKDYGEQGTDQTGISGIKDTRPFAHSFLIPN